MSLPYKYFVDDAVLEVFCTTSKLQRGKLLRTFDQLAANPFQQGDAIQLDRAGRPCQVKRFADWTITYWVEHLVETVYILSVDYLRLR